MRVAGKKTGEGGREQHRAGRGFTLVEAMVLLVILGVVAVGMGTALQSLTRTPENNDLALAISNRLTDKMEELRATPFGNLAVGTTSDVVHIRTTDYTRTAKIELWDASGDGTLETDFKQITVSIGGQAVVTWVTNLGS